MIVAIYLTEFQVMLPVNTVVPISNIDRPAREKRGREHRQPAFFELLDKETAKRSDNYDSNGQFIEAEQFFNKLA